MVGVYYYVVICGFDDDSTLFLQLAKIIHPFLKGFSNFPSIPRRGATSEHTKGMRRVSSFPWYAQNTRVGVVSIGNDQNIEKMCVFLYLDCKKRMLSSVIVKTAKLRFKRNHGGCLYYYNIVSCGFDDDILFFTIGINDTLVFKRF